MLDMKLGGLAAVSLFLSISALAALRISVNVTAHFANNVTGASTRLRGV